MIVDKDFRKLPQEQQEEILMEEYRKETLSRCLDALRLTERLLENGKILEKEDTNKAIHKFVCDLCMAVIKAFNK